MLEECLHCQSQASMTRRSSVDSDLDCVRNGPSGSGRAGTRTVTRCRSPDKPMLLISSSHEKQTAIKPRASRDRKFNINESQWGIESPRHHLGAEHLSHGPRVALEPLPWPGRGRGRQERRSAGRTFASSLRGRRGGAHLCTAQAALKAARLPGRRPWPGDGCDQFPRCESAEPGRPVPTPSQKLVQVWWVTKIF